MTYTLILLNSEGASDETRGLETIRDVIAQIDIWADTDTMTARVFDSDGACIYDGVADGFRVTEHDTDTCAV